MKLILKILWAFAIVWGVGFGVIVWAGWVIEREGAPALAEKLETLPYRPVALVLGCSPTTSAGRRNPFFVNRIQAAAAVYHAHKVDYLLVSGDRHMPDYDEPLAMRNALMRLGVPDHRITLDEAGFSTLDSIVRARAVFGLSRFCIVTQRDHALRAVFLARRRQLDVVAFPAPEVRVMDGLRTRLRESFARVRALLDVTIFSRQPKVAGPRIQIGTGANSLLPTPALRLAARAGQLGESPQ